MEVARWADRCGRGSLPLALLYTVSLLGPGLSSSSGRGLRPRDIATRRDEVDRRNPTAGKIEPASAVPLPRTSRWRWMRACNPSRRMEATSKKAAPNQATVGAACRCLPELESLASWTEVCRRTSCILLEGSFKVAHGRRSNCTSRILPRPRRSQRASAGRTSPGCSPSRCRILSVVHLPSAQ